VVLRTTLVHATDDDEEHRDIMAMCSNSNTTTTTTATAITAITSITFNFCLIGKFFLQSYSRLAGLPQERIFGNS